MSNGIAVRSLLLAKLIGVDFNSTADQVLQMINASKYIIRNIFVTNASASLAGTVGGIYTEANKTGTEIVSAAQAFDPLTTALKYLDLTLTPITSSQVFTASSLYFSLTTEKGSAATADLYIFGDVLL